MWLHGVVTSYTLGNYHILLLLAVVTARFASSRDGSQFSRNIEDIRAT